MSRWPSTSRLRNVLVRFMSDRGINPVLRSRLGVELTHWRDLTQDLLRLLGRDVAVVFDVGAHIGETSILFTELFQAATIYAFEPHPESFSQLAAAVPPRVISHRLALGAHNSTATMYVHRQPWTNSLLEATDFGRALFPDQLQPTGTVIVDVETLDSFCNRSGVQTIDLLKLDVQGFELQVLNGARHVLTSVKAVLTEVNFVPQYAGSATFSDLDMHLRDAGFQLYDLYNLRRDLSSRRLVFGDALFIR